MIVAPVSFHRVLFRQHERDWLVAATHRCARAGLLLCGLVSAGVLLLVFDVVVGVLAGLVAAAVALVVLVVLWLVVPAVMARRSAP